MLGLVFIPRMEALVIMATSVATSVERAAAISLALFERTANMAIYDGINNTGPT